MRSMILQNIDIVSEFVNMLLHAPDSYQKPGSLSLSLSTCEIRQFQYSLCWTSSLYPRWKTLNHGENRCWLHCLPRNRIAESNDLLPSVGLVFAASQRTARRPAWCDDLEGATSATAWKPTHMLGYAFEWIHTNAYYHPSTSRCGRRQTGAWSPKSREPKGKSTGRDLLFVLK